MNDGVVVLLGGSGDIGSVIVNKLAQQQVRFVSPTSRQLDLTQINSTREFFSSISGQYSIVFSVIDRRFGDSEATFSSNIKIIQNLLDVCSPTAFLFMSSIDVYGKCPKNPITESTEVDEGSVFSRVKLSIESKLEEALFDLCPLLTLRLPGVYAGGARRNSALENILRRGFKDGVINLGQNGLQLRDWIHADDVARFAMEFLKTPTVGKFNFVTGQSISIDEYVVICLNSLNGIRHIRQTEEVELSSSNKGYFFDPKQFRKSFPNWKFHDRRESLYSFSKEIYKNLKNF